MTTTEQQRTAPPKTATGVIVYTPMGESAPIELSIPMVRSFLTTPTRSGKHPSEQDVMKFMLLCKARELNPWVGDAYLIGFDSQDGPQFNLITAVQALLKRSEMNQQFDGIESGIIVLRAKEAVELVGQFKLPGDVLVGGWARVHRKDRKIPVETKINLSARSTGRSRWKADAEGMIEKCAIADALRKAFANQVSALYLEGELQDGGALDGPGDGHGGPREGGPNDSITRSATLASTLAPTKPSQPPADEIVDADYQVNEPAKTAPQKPTEEKPAPNPPADGEPTDGQLVASKIQNATDKQSLQVAWGEANQLKIAKRISDDEWSVISEYHQESLDRITGKKGK